MKSMLHKKLLKHLIVFIALTTSFGASAQMFVHSPIMDIPDNNTAGIKDTISIFDSGTISDLNIPINIYHSNIGDIFVTLESPNGTVVTLIDRPGFTVSGTGCHTNGINVTLVDTASQAIENACPAVVGNYYSPQSPLSAFFGESITGDWILTVSDNLNIDTGDLHTWKLVFNNDNSVPPVIYVNENATGNNNGSSWADAYTELSDATKSAWGNQIWVAQGTYLPHESDREKSFHLFDSVEIYGGFSGNESALAERNWNDNPTILSGDLLGDDNGIVTYDEPSRDDNTHVLIRVRSNNVVIDGVTIRDANANNSNNYFNRGAAIYKDNGVNHLIVKHCILENNTAKLTSGIHAEFHTANSQVDHSMRVDKCVFRQNVSAYATAFGIASFHGTVNAVVSNCLITQNRSESNSASDCFGSSAGFFDSRNSSVLNAFLVNCTITNNEENEDVGIPVASPIGVRKFGPSSTLNFVAANNIFHENEINSLNGVTATFGGLNSSNCPTSRLLQNNIRPDYDVLQCTPMTTSNGELDTLGILLDANGKPMTGSVAINAGDTTGVSQYVTEYDLANTERILDGTIDIGCYENCSNTIDLTTSTYNQVDVTYVEVAMAGPTATYQWLDCNNNNAPIPGLIGNSFLVSQNGSYACAITDGCATDTTDCVIIDDLSVNEIPEIKVFLFPNPTTGILNIKNGSGSATIMDLTGKIVLESIDVTDEQIDVSNLLNGVYLLQLKTEKGIATQRFIKE